MHNILIAAGTGLAAAVAGVTFGFGGSDEPAMAPDSGSRSQIHEDPVSGGWEPGDRLGPPDKKYVDSRTGGRQLDPGA